MVSDFHATMIRPPRAKNMRKVQVYRRLAPIIIDLRYTIMHQIYIYITMPEQHNSWNLGIHQP